MCSLMKDSYINIKQIAEAKGLKSTHSLRLEIFEQVWYDIHLYL